MKYHLKLTELQEQIIALVSNETKKGEVLTVMDVSNKLNIPYATAHDNLNILKHYNKLKQVSLKHRGYDSKRKYWVAPKTKGGKNED